MSRLSKEMGDEYMANNHEIWFGVAAYRIVQRLPKELKGQLPGPEEIARLLEDGG